MKKTAFLLAALSLFVESPIWADDDEKGEDTRPFVSINQEDIVNKTGILNANFSTLIDRLNHELVSSGLYRVMEMDDMVKAIKKTDMMKVAADDNPESKISTPGFFIGMTITTFGFSRAGSQNPLTGVSSASEEARVELILKIVDARTAETIKSANIDGKAVGMATTSSNLKEQVLQTACKTVCGKIVFEMIKLTSFGVLDVEDGVVSVDIPGTLKIMGRPISPGLIFNVNKMGKGKKSKRTGKVARTEKTVATIQIEKVGEESCSAKITSGEIKPIGDDEDTEYDPYIVRLAESAMPVQPPPPNDKDAPF